MYIYIYSIYETTCPLESYFDHIESNHGTLPIFDIGIAFLGRGLVI